MNQEFADKTAKEEPHEAGRPFLPNHIVEEIGVIFLITGIILIAASLLRPEELGFPHVFFAGISEMVRAVAPWFAAAAMTILVVFLLALPFLDRSKERHPMKRKIYLIVIVALIAVWLFFTVLGF